MTQGASQRRSRPVFGPPLLPILRGLALPTRRGLAAGLWQATADEGAPRQAIEPWGETEEHEVTLQGLEPGRSYRYRLEDGQRPYTFRTRPGPEAPFSLLLVWGDVAGHLPRLLDEPAELLVSLTPLAAVGQDDPLRQLRPSLPYRAAAAPGARSALPRAGSSADAAARGPAGGRAGEYGRELMPRCCSGAASGRGGAAPSRTGAGYLLCQALAALCLLPGLFSGCRWSEGCAGGGSGIGQGLGPADGVPAAPPFQLDTLAHGRFYLAEQQGRVVVLVFWTTSCLPCKEELLELERLRGEPSLAQMQPAAICADPESGAELRRIAAELKLGYPLLLDRQGAVTARYGVRSFPATVLVDGQGRLRHRRVGWAPGDARALRLQLERLLAVAGPAAAGKGVCPDAGPYACARASAGAHARTDGGAGEGAGMGAEAAAGGGFTIAPYLLDNGADSATIAFQLVRPSPAEVRLYPLEEPAGAPLLRSSPVAARQHFVRVDGLVPGRSYRYEVEAGQGAARTPLGDPTFRLSTAALPGETFTFAVYGDTRVGEAGSLRHHRSIVEQALAVEPSFVLLLGDLVDDGRQAALWEELFRIAAPLLRRAAAFPVLGESDHARGEGLAARYFPSLEQGWYHFAWGDAYFFGMLAWDTRGAQPAATFDEQSPQLRWLDGWLARPEVQGASFRVVFLHDPVQTVRGRSAERFRRVWGPLLARRRVDVVFASWHLYERSMRDGVVFVASGGAGAQLVWMAPEPGAAPALAEARRHHFCRVDVRPGAMEIRAIAEDGTMLDSVVLVPRPADGPAPSGLRRAAQALRRRISIPAAAADAPLVGMLLFCHARARCRRLLEHELPRQARQAGVALEVSLYDLGRQGSYELLRTAEADFGREAAVLPALFLGRTLLAGPTKIATGLPAELRAAAGDPAGYGQRAATPFARGHDARQLRAEELGRLDPPALLRAGVVDSTKPEAWSMLALLGLLLCSATGTLRQRLGRGALLVASLLGGMVGLAIVRHRYAGLPEAAVLLGLGVDALLLVLLLRRLARAPWPGRARPAAESSAAGQERWWSLLTGALLPALGLLLVPLQLLAAGRVYLPLVAALADPLQRAPAFARLLLYLVGFGAPLGAMLAGALLLQRGAAWLRSAKGGVAGAGSVATAGGAATTHWSWTTLSLLGQLAALAVLLGGVGSLLRLLPW